MKIENVILGPLAESPLKPPEKGEKNSGASFNDILKDSMQRVSDLEKDANKQVESLTKMESQDVHNTMIAMEKADLSFHLMMQVRNKIISAYEEVMRMQV
jgi:flagellar hook-basal body complex protein FliE